MPAEDPLLAYITSKLPAREIPPPPTTDYLRAGGDNPYLNAYITSKLYPAAAPQAQTTSPAPDDEVVWAPYELEAWAGLDDAQRAGCLRGNKASTDQWVAAVLALEAEAAEQG
jgi:hypothetical protein